MLQKAKRDGFELITIKNASELTTELNKFKMGQITNMYYYGHSNRNKLFVEYSSIVPSVSSDDWEIKDAEKVKKEIFSPVAVFASYGCHQGEKKGFAEKIRDIWDITSVGSVGKTDYGPIGRGISLPSSEGGYKEYERVRNASVINLQPLEVK